ncbi:MAG: DUF1194 domain-containing protein [Pseudomonadota bacterium]
MVKALLFAAVIASVSAPAQACRLALALGLDISSSVDPREDALQRGGVAAALQAPEVIAAFFKMDDPVALTVFEWSGRYNQEVLLDWTLITNPATLAQAAEAVRLSRRSHNEFATSMGEALIFGARLFRNAPECLFKTIDLSGDGVNNEGPGPRIVYERSAFDDITVNGLAIANAADFQTAERLTEFYQTEVLHGAGAFMVVADGFEDYARAMRQKLEREVTPAVIGTLFDQGLSR